MSIITDNTVLVHIYSGLESKNKITLGLLVALTAEKNDHKVRLFLAGDGVQILNCKKAGEIVGQGTGDYTNIFKIYRIQKLQYMSQEWLLNLGGTMRSF